MCDPVSVVVVPACGVGWGELFTSFRAVTVTCNNYYSMIDERSKAFGQLLSSTAQGLPSVLCCYVIC